MSFVWLILVLVVGVAIGWNAHIRYLRNRRGGMIHD